LVEAAAVTVDGVRIPYQRFGYGAWEEEDGVCSNKTESGRYRSQPLNVVGIVLVSVATSLGVIVPIFVLFLFSIASISPLMAPGPRREAVAALGAAAVGLVVAFLGLASDVCRGEGRSCEPAPMAYVVVGGAACWVVAGLALAIESPRGRREQRRAQQRRERSGREFVVGMPAREAEMTSSFGAEIPVALAVSDAPYPYPDQASAATVDEPSSTTVLSEKVTECDGMITTTTRTTTTITTYGSDGRRRVVEKTVEVEKLETGP
jgi:hypothetical protein